MRLFPGYTARGTPQANDFESRKNLNEAISPLMFDFFSFHLTVMPSKSQGHCEFTMHSATDLDNFEVLCAQLQEASYIDECPELQATSCGGGFLKPG